MISLCDKLQIIGNSIARSVKLADRKENSVKLLAVSKLHPSSSIREAYACGQRMFGENYAQEMLDKAEELHDLDIEWHFIGSLQSNKTKQVAAVASWVHTVDRLKIAKRLSEQRPEGMPPLSICLQVNISDEESKSGISAKELPTLVEEVAKLPNILLRGLMVIPEVEANFDRQSAVFTSVRVLQEGLNTDNLAKDIVLDTLSMGMSTDMKAAIMEGATIVRVGTAIFGLRKES
ncbi:MAG TPA: YggS family pyridoxal phosphate-dependent enzyme [Leucothrix mucor]|nr:YggS family pyridoxal phosphate-dependent enzyme [Leucothrix mucor]